MYTFEMFSPVMIIILVGKVTVPRKVHFPKILKQAPSTVNQVVHPAFPVS